MLYKMETRMIQKIKIMALSLFLSVSTGAVALLPGATAFAQSNAAQSAAVCEGAGAVSGGACANTGGTVSSLVKTGIRILQVIAGTIAVFFVIFGGIRYVTSSGDPAKLNTAKNTIIYACIGVAIVALSEVIVQFTLNSLDTV
jgi:hypothetical protein